MKDTKNNKMTKNNCICLKSMFLRVFFLLFLAINVESLRPNPAPMVMKDKNHISQSDGDQDPVKEMHTTGSSLPDCSHACGPCSPCKRVMVSVKCSIPESCAIIYRCMCRGRYYQRRVRLALTVNPATPRILGGSRWVEVTGTYQHIGYDCTGGGFILRDIDGTPLLAEAFSTNGSSSFHAEALALLQTMRIMIELGEDDVVLCHGSPRLQRTLMDGAELPRGRVREVLIECAALWGRRRSHGMVCWPRERLAASYWLANCGRRCQQRCRWTGPWPEELEALF